MATSLFWGALYPVLYKLESEGLLITTTEVVDNRVRKYYSLTPEGRKVAKVKVSELQEFNRILGLIVGESSTPKVSLKIS